MLFRSRESDPAGSVQSVNDYWGSKAKVLATLEFNRDRKSMSVLTRPDGKKTNQLLVKGAPEGVIARCTSARLADGTTVPFSAADRKAVLKYVEEMAARPLRSSLPVMSHGFDFCGVPLTRAHLEGVLGGLPEELPVLAALLERSRGMHLTGGFL